MARAKRSTPKPAKRVPRPVRIPATPAVPPPCAAAGLDCDQTIALRDLFWNNVVRDMLNGLAVLTETQPDLFDGRFGILTHQGERIPIAHVHPLFACSITGSPAERDASAAVQCTVFRIQTPEGEVFTLPVQEIRAIHTMTPELIEKLQALSESEAEGDKSEADHPFGLAAFTALPKGPAVAAPEHPTE
jgi:hypothetical protein